MRVVVMVGALVALSGSALGGTAVHDNGATLDARGVFGPVQMSTGLADRGGSILYNSSTETGFRYNPGGAGTGGVPPADNARTAYDDIPISDAILEGATAIDVCRVTVGIRRIAGAPATDVSVFWSTLSTTVTAPDTELDLPSNLIGTQSFGAAAASTTQLVTFGASGGPTLFTAPLNTTLISGFGMFTIGVNLSSTDSLNGWRMATGAANANIFWMHDPGLTGQANPEAAYLFSQATPPNPNAQFYIIIEGTAVPTPGSAALLGLAGIAAIRRRRA